VGGDVVVDEGRGEDAGEGEVVAEGVGPGEHAVHQAHVYTKEAIESDSNNACIPPAHRGIMKRLEVVVAQEGVKVAQVVYRGSAEVDMDLINATYGLGKRHHQEVVNVHDIHLTKRTNIRVRHHLGEEGREDEGLQIKIYSFISFEPRHNEYNC
jgi:hypothetical protein